jgi:hypothetical protein
MVPKLCSLAAISCLAIGACAGDAPPAATARRVSIDARASVELPEGWAASSAAGRMIFRPEGSDRDAPRVDVTAVPKRDYGVVRTPQLALDSVRAQVAPQGANLVEPSFTLAGTRPAGWLDWTYRAADGAARSRRHWVVELPSTTVHVSCVSDADTRVEPCDAIARSALELPQVALAANEGGRR